MLTLKILLYETDGTLSTYVFEANEINHKEFALYHEKGSQPVGDAMFKEHSDLVIFDSRKEHDREDDSYVVEYSRFVLGGYSGQKEDFIINVGGKSYCYIMSGGQTVDKVILA